MEELYQRPYKRILILLLGGVDKICQDTQLVKLKQVEWEEGCLQLIIEETHLIKLDFLITIGEKTVHLPHATWGDSVNKTLDNPLKITWRSSVQNPLSTQKLTCMFLYVISTDEAVCKTHCQHKS